MPEVKVDLRPYPLLERVVSFWQARRVTVHLVGGFVRDLVMGRPPRDADLAVDTDPLQAARLTADTFGGSFVVVSDAPRWEVGRAVLPELTLDFTRLSGDLEHDLARRDFAIDAMAVDWSHYPEATVIDPWGGLKDLADRLVRALDPGVFEQDPARLLRGPRLAAELSFSLEPGTAQSIREQSGLLAKVSAERLRDEVCKLLAASGSAPYVFLLEELGLLTGLVPELEASREVTQPPEHHWDVFHHALEAVARAEALLERTGTPEILSAVPWGPDLEAHFAEEVSSGRRRSMLLKLAALVHDVAKPAMKTVEDSGRIHFYGHAREGSTMAEAILERLRFSAREVRMVGLMVEHHLRPRQMVSQDEDLPTPRAIYRYYRDLGDVALDTLYLNLADHWASRGPDLVLEDWRQHAATVSYVLEQWQRGTPIARPPRLVTGHDLMRELGLAPGPLVGEVLEYVKEAQASGQVATREQALEWARRYLVSLKGAQRRSNPQTVPSVPTCRDFAALAITKRNSSSTDYG
ncbi:MAG: CCA tRNA nucleotidyltransferase [Chloroflexi bacterium]|nr:CCA tRNA nucleotidyltransferase [Chloroflexota bacterium]